MSDVTIADVKAQFTNIVRAATRDDKGKTPVQIREDRAVKAAVIAKALDRLADELGL